MSSRSCYSSSNSRKKTKLVKCDCGLISPVRIAGTKRNNGRRFMGCRRYGESGSCNFFEWVDSNSERGTDYGKELMGKLEQIEDEGVDWQRQIKRLELELKIALQLVENLKDENLNLKSVLESKNKKKSCVDHVGVIACGCVMILWLITIVALL